MARGFWGPAENLHARVAIGLCAAELERVHGAEGFAPARLTVDLYKLPDLSPIEITTRVVRASGRMKVVEADFISGGVPSVRATCQFLRRTEPPPGEVWRGPKWDAPPPEQVSAPNPLPIGGRWEVRPVSGAFSGDTPGKVWLREVRALIGGEDYTPFSRIATGVDFVSPLSNSSGKGLGFINTDVTLYLHRPMVGEWVGYEVTNHQSSDGVAIGQCTLHDVDGPVGFGSCAALAQRKPPRP